MRISDWSSDVCSSDLHYGNDAGGSRFSPLRQIDATNLARLQPAWVFRTGKAQGATPVTFEATPIMAKGRLYICTGRNEVIAIDAESGRSLRSEEHTSELQSLIRISYAVFCLKKKNEKRYHNT